LPHIAFALQIRQNHGLLNLTSTYVRTLSPASGKVRYAHRPPLFCPLSAEAYLLTGKKHKHGLFAKQKSDEA